MENNLQADEKWVHFIGIGGVAMAPLAIEFRKNGYRVTGSDKKLYDPIKSLLESAQTKGELKVNSDFDYKNLIDGEKVPGLVVCGSGISLLNKEYLFAKKQGLVIKHYPEILQEKVIVENSIVVAGTYAKTTVTAMLVNIFKSAGKNISYMFGALPVDGSNSIAFKNEAGSTEFSIVEGDEYISSRWDMKSKFFYYKPKYLVITALEWDHTDIFKTKEDYLNNFAELVKQVPEDGFILLFGNSDKDFILAGAKCKTKRISVDELLSWGKDNEIKTNLIGSYNYVNTCIAGYFTQALEIVNIDLNAVKTSLASFQGIKRRMEKRFESADKNLIIFDDFASSPAKVKGSLETVKQAFPAYKVVAIYEPNIGSRTNEALTSFPGVFKQADQVLLPEFTSIVKSDNYPLTNDALMDILKSDGISSTTCSNDQELINAAVQIAKSTPKTVFIFMASSGMEERINSLINSIK